MKKIVENIKTRFKVSDVIHQRENMTFVTTGKESAIPLITWLRDYEGFSHFILLSTVDWNEDGFFQLTYLLNNPVKKVDLGIRTFIL